MQKYVLSELDSGQRVITERIPSVRSVALGFWIGAGSRDETPSKAGISHFIEHLLFKGTRSYTAQDIAEIFDGLGGELNAATSREHTLVYVRVADHHFEQALDVMSDMVYAPLFADLDSEREVVLEEIAMYEDTPHELVHDLMSEAVFGDHPLGRPVIGTAEVISSVGRRALTTYHQTMYQAGQRRRRRRGEPEARRPRRAAREGAAQAGENARAGAAPAQAARAAAAPERPLPAQEHRAVPRLHRRPGIARSDRRRFAASLLDALLGGSASSRLFQEIREKRGMAYSVYTFASQYTDTRADRLLRRDARGEPRRLPRDRERADRRGRGGQARKGELERAKENLKGRILLSMESTSNRMSRLGKSLITDTELLSIDRIAAEIDAVTPEAVSELAGVLLAPEKLSASGIGPSEERFREAVRRIKPELPARAAA